MARYSVATTKDNLSKLIDKALAGEEVVITRHGKPTVELRVVADVASPAPIDHAPALEQLRRSLSSLPPMPLSYLEMKRLDEADGAY